VRVASHRIEPARYQRLVPLTISRALQTTKLRRCRPTPKPTRSLSAPPLCAAVVAEAQPLRTLTQPYPTFPRFLHPFWH